MQCEGCCNPEFQAHDSGQCLTVRMVFDMILATPDIEGVTYSGGEPFEQAEALTLLSRLCRQAGLTVMTYSGSTYEELCRRDDSHVRGLLSLLDVLVDGPFESSHAAPLLWRGSHNQRVHFLTDHYHVYAFDVEQEFVELEFCIDGDTLSITGMAEDRALRDLIEKIRMPMQQ